MRILEICPFSSGICGVFTRAREEAVRLKMKGHQVEIFSSNLVKGSDEIAKENDLVEGIKIKRFPVAMPGKGKLWFVPGGESYMFWNYNKLWKEIKRFKPDIIITHTHRHTHSIFVSIMGRKIGAKTFLVTHAPFNDDSRSIIAKLYIKFIDNLFVSKPSLKRFNRIIAITKWERPYLQELDVGNDKIEYIPNGIPEEFFSAKKGKEENKILFLGRISPIKDIETLIKAFYLIRDKEIKLEIVGPGEKEYLVKLKELVSKLNIGRRVIFSPAIYDIKSKIAKIDSSKIFVLPSKREAMPQALIEVMAREKIVVASANLGAKDIIRDRKNGFLFEIGNENALASLIDGLLKEKNEKIKKEARKSVKQFSWDKIIKKIEKVIES